MTTDETYYADQTIDLDPLLEQLEARYSNLPLIANTFAGWDIVLSCATVRLVPDDGTLIVHVLRAGSTQATWTQAPYCERSARGLIDLLLQLEVAAAGTSMFAAIEDARGK